MHGPKHFILRYLTVAFGFPYQGCEPIGKASAFPFNSVHCEAPSLRVHPSTFRMVQLYTTEAIWQLFSLVTTDGVQAHRCHLDAPGDT